MQVLPIDNAAIQSFAQMEASQRNNPKGGSGSLPKDTDTMADSKASSRKKGFLEMNAVVARMLCHLTASSRFHGEMNVDMNEICTNLVPFPRMKFLMSALSPLRVVARHASTQSQLVGKATIQRGFSDILGPVGQLTSVHPCQDNAVTLACAFLARGEVMMSDFITCVTTAQSKSLTFPYWNQDATKIGMCRMPAPGHKVSVLGVYNSTAFGSVLKREHSRFNTLFKRKAMLHHYTEFVDVQAIADAEVAVASAIEDYNILERGANQSTDLYEDEEGGANTLMQQRFTARYNDIELFPAF